MYIYIYTNLYKYICITKEQIKNIKKNFVLFFSYKCGERLYKYKKLYVLCIQNFTSIYQNFKKFTKTAHSLAS